MKTILIYFLVLSSSAFANWPNQQAKLLDAGVKTLTVTNSGTGGSDVTVSCGATGTDRCAISIIETNVYPNLTDTTSSTAIAAGTRTITVGSTVGMKSGFQGEVDDGASQERVTFTVNSTTSLTGVFAKSHSGTYHIRGTYYSACSNPCSVRVDRNDGTSYYVPEVVDSSGNPYSPRKISNQLLAIPQVPITEAPGAWTFPIEVTGGNGYTTYKQANIPAGAATTSLRMVLVIANPGYQAKNPVDGKCSVNVNGGSWIAISNANATGIDEAKYYGPEANGANIGNAVGIRILTLSIPNGSITANSTATFGFRFNGTDGVTSGCYVLDFNLISASIQIDNTSININTVDNTTHSAHGLSTNDWVWDYGIAGAWGVANGLRQITVTSSTHFTHAACTTVDFLDCQSPNGTYNPPVSRADYDPTFYQFTQPKAWMAKAVIPGTNLGAQDVPSSWTAPVGSDASRGQTLWNAPGLVVPNFEYNNGISKTSCGSGFCHLRGGEDLEALNFSNHSIRIRSMFHGLLKQDGDDVAAYIRSLSTSAAASTPMGRPYNPIYQPGSGLDSHSVYNWMAGAGWQSVLTYDHDSPICAPGSTSAPDSQLNVRQLPIHTLLPDWLHWLPAIYMGDYFATFDASDTKSYYDAAWSGITAGDNTSFYNYDFYMQGFVTTNFIAGWYATVNPIPGKLNPQPGYQRPSLFNLALLSAKLWIVDRTLDIYRLKGFEGTLDTQYTTLYGSSTYGYFARGIQNQTAFQAAPHFQRAINSYGIYDETGATWDYLSYATYQLQFIWNNGNRRQDGGNPSDIGYQALFQQSLGNMRPNMCLSTIVYTSPVQGSLDWPHISDITGFNPQALRPQIGPFGNGQQALGGAFTTDTERAAMATRYVTDWLAVYAIYGLTEMQAGYAADIAGHGPCCDPTSGVLGTGNMLSAVAYYLPIFKYYGVSTTLLGDMADKAALICSACRDFRALDLAATCTWSSGVFAGYSCTNVP